MFVVVTVGLLWVLRIMWHSKGVHNKFSNSTNNDITKDRKQLPQSRTTVYASIFC